MDDLHNKKKNSKNKHTYSYSNKADDILGLLFLYMLPNLK